MKLYAVTDEYIDYLRQFDYKVYDNKEDRRKVMRKYFSTSNSNIWKKEYKAYK